MAEEAGAGVIPASRVGALVPVRFAPQVARCTRVFLRTRSGVNISSKKNATAHPLRRLRRDFIAEPRSAGRQRYCARVTCRKASRRESQRRWQSKKRV